MANVVSLNDIVKYLREHSVFNVDGYTDTNGNVISQIKVNKITENSHVGSFVNINVNTDIGSSKSYTWTFDSSGNLITPVETTAGFINGVKLTNNTSVRSAIMSTGDNSLGVVETSPDRLFIGNAGGRRIYSESDNTLWVVNNRDEKPAATWIRNYYDTDMTAYRQRYSNKIYTGNTYGDGTYYSAGFDFFHFNAGTNDNTARIRFEAFYRGYDNENKTWYNNYRMRFSLRQRPDNMSYLQFLPHSESRGPNDSYGDGNWHTIVSNNNFSSYASSYLDSEFINYFRNWLTFEDLTISYNDGSARTATGRLLTAISSSGRNYSIYSVNLALHNANSTTVSTTVTLPFSTNGQSYYSVFINPYGTGSGATWTNGPRIINKADSTFDIAGTLSSTVSTHYVSVLIIGRISK